MGDKMIKHIVMFKLAQNTSENINTIVSALRGMEGRIETLKHIEVGVNIRESDRSFDVVLTTHFEDQKGLDIYINHDVHKPVVETVRSLCQKSVVVDYEI